MKRLFVSLLFMGVAGIAGAAGQSTAPASGNQTLEKT